MLPTSPVVPPDDVVSPFSPPWSSVVPPSLVASSVVLLFSNVSVVEVVSLLLSVLSPVDVVPSLLVVVSVGGIYSLFIGNEGKTFYPELLYMNLVDILETSVPRTMYWKV